MGCVPSRQSMPPGKTQEKINPLEKAYDKLKPMEVNILSLIYNDFASRILQKKMNMESFLHFFHKNGFWGQKLYKQFDTDDSKLLSEEEFVRGIVKIFKTTEHNKILLLYHFFAKDQRGISFDDFVTLYSYPKTDLKQILDDEDFLETEVMKKLKELKNKKSQIKEAPTRSQSDVYRIDDSDAESEYPVSSAYGFNRIIQEINNKRKVENTKMTLNMHLNGKQVEVKTGNIQHLVKKFARKLFEQLNLDVLTGRITKEQFEQWIMGHKNLYNNYYDGFHNEVWELGDNNTPMYKISKSEKTSEARTIWQGSMATIKLYLFNSTLILTKVEQDEPLGIICLDGLIVKEQFEADRGFGIEISHRDGIYVPKRLFFKNQQTCLEWMEFLKYFKGQSLQQKYAIGEKIGTGKFSIVYAAKENKSGRQFAVKEISNSNLGPQARQLIAHESSIMSVLNHPLLCQFKESFQTKTHIYIVTELVKGKDLLEFVKSSKYLSEELAARIIRQIIIAVKYLHGLGIIHRDLKPENVMIVTEQQLLHIKIIDFGFSNYKASLQNIDPSQLLAGTPGYTAPEVLNYDTITEKIDNFSIGAILFYCLCGSSPFNGRNITEIFGKTIDGAYSFDAKVWRTVSLEAKDLISKLLIEEKDKRMSLDEALKHAWFSKTKEIGGCEVSLK